MNRISRLPQEFLLGIAFSNNIEKRISTDAVSLDTANVYPFRLPNIRNKMILTKFLILTSRINRSASIASVQKPIK